MRRLCLELKNQRFYLLIPPFVLFVLLPLAVITTTKAGGRFPECCFMSQLFIPGFASWWPLLVLKEYLHSPGRELLFVHKRGQDSLLLKMIILWGLYMLLAVAVFACLVSPFPTDPVWPFLPVLAAQSMFMIAMAYVLSLSLQNTFMPLIANFAYVMVFMLSIPLIGSPLSIFAVGLSGSAGLSKAAVLAVVALALLGVGYQIENRLYRNSI